MGVIDRTETLEAFSILPKKIKDIKINKVERGITKDIIGWVDVVKKEEREKFQQKILKKGIIHPGDLILFGYIPPEGDRKLVLAGHDGVSLADSDIDSRGKAWCGNQTSCTTIGVIGVLAVIGSIIALIIGGDGGGDENQTGGATVTIPALPQ